MFAHCKVTAHRHRRQADVAPTAPFNSNLLKGLPIAVFSLSAYRKTVPPAIVAVP